MFWNIYKMWSLHYVYFTLCEILRYVTLSLCDVYLRELLRIVQLYVLYFSTLTNVDDKWRLNCVKLR